MRYQVLLTMFFFLLIAKTGFTQNVWQSAIHQAVVPVNPDTVDLDMRSPVPHFEVQPLSDSGLYFGMPIVKPFNKGAKMKYWWPSTDYNYTMPNAYPGKVKLFQFKYPKDNK